MKMTRIIRQAHQGLGLLVGIQVFLWISGGFVMSALPLGKVRGEDRIAARAATPVDPAENLVSPGAIARQEGWAGLDRAELFTWQGQPVYRLSHGDQNLLADARSGNPLPPLSEQQARQVALDDYQGPGNLAGVSRQTEPESEIRGRDLPLWRVEFDDGRRTTLYVSPLSGDVVARRNNIWRVYDFFWMLHIMDYGGRDNFNHPLLIVAAVTAWVLATSGIWLVVTWLGRRRRKR